MTDNTKYLSPKNFVEQSAIKEKIALLQQYKDGLLTQEGVIKIIQDRRINWIKNNIDKLRGKYQNLSYPLLAHQIIFFEHMYIYPPHSVVIEISDKLIIIRSYNFCPYLEACQLLNLDTKFVCKHVCEKPFQEMIKYIHPDLKFWRNYNKIRPYEKYCEEYIGLN